MAVEIVGQDERQFKHTSCSGCGSKLRYTKNDVFTHIYSACGHTESDPAINCPGCNRVIIVSR